MKKVLNRAGMMNGDRRWVKRKELLPEGITKKSASNWGWKVMSHDSDVNKMYLAEIENVGT